jgi:glutamate/tyrosine decarboxylase-like PLP-dependent enzyme
MTLVPDAAEQVAAVPTGPSGPIAAVVDAASRAALDYLLDLPGRRVSPAPDDLAALATLDVDLPDEPRDPVDVVDELHRVGSPATTASAGGRFFGLVVGGTLPAALGARLLTSAWDQVVFNDQISPVGCALERIAAGWITDMLGLPPEAHVSYVTGATMGNLHRSGRGS